MCCPSTARNVRQLAKKKMEAVGPLAYQVWYQDHMSECQNNVDGSSSMMEEEGAKVMSLRSTAGKLRYTTIL